MTPVAFRELFLWLMVGGAAWLVVEHEMTRFSPRHMTSRSRRCVPDGGRTAKFCADGVLRTWEALTP